MSDQTTKEALFVRYRAELTLRPEIRARTRRQLQERLARGDRPRPESDVPPPAAATVHGLSGAQLGLAAATTFGLAVGVVAWLLTPGSPASEQPRATAPVVRQSEAPTPVAAVSEPEAPTLAAAATEVPLPKAASETAAPVAVPSETSRSAAAMSVSAPRTGRSKAQRPAAAPTAGSKPPAAPEGPIAAKSQENPVPLSTPVDPLPISRASTPPSAAAGTATTGTRRDAAPTANTLSRELQLLQGAQLALRAGNTQRALALLAEHTWTFPHGALAEAREVARIVALCQAGHVAQSKQYAARFLQQRPSSPFAQRVRAGCDP